MQKLINDTIKINNQLFDLVDLTRSTHEFGNKEIIVEMAKKQRELSNFLYIIQEEELCYEDEYFYRIGEMRLKENSILSKNEVSQTALKAGEFEIIDSWLISYINDSRGHISFIKRFYII